MLGLSEWANAPYILGVADTQDDGKERSLHSHPRPDCAGVGKPSEDSSKKQADKKMTEAAKTDNETHEASMPDTEEAEPEKQKKARVKSDKIPVPRKLKKAATPPDPCNYTAKKSDDDNTEKKGSKGASKKSKTDELKLPSAKTAYFFFAADQRGPLKSMLLLIYLHTLYMATALICCDASKRLLIHALLQVSTQISLLERSAKSLVRR